jgi:hypothetical protein
MSLLQLFENKHINKELDDNIIDGSQLLLNNLNYNKKKEIIIEESPTFNDSEISHLYNIRNLKNPISYFYYLYETYFIGVLCEDDIYNIKTYNDLYKIFLNKLFSVNIIEINIAETNIVNNIHLVIVKTSHCELLPNKKTITLIKPTDCISCEQTSNTFITQDINANKFNVNVEQITLHSIIVKTNHKLIYGSPLYTNNILVGLFFLENNNKLQFYRISYFLNWIYKFLKDYKQVLNNTLSKNVVFSNQQLYSIINELNKKVEGLENQILENENKRIKMPFQDIIEKNNSSTKSDIELLEIIDNLKNHIKEQDKKINYLYENFKKMGF